MSDLSGRVPSCDPDCTAPGHGWPASRVHDDARCPVHGPCVDTGKCPNCDYEQPITGRVSSRFTYHGEDGHLFAPSAEDTWVCSVCGDEVGDHQERPGAGRVSSASTAGFHRSQHGYGWWLNIGKRLRWQSTKGTTRMWPRISYGGDENCNRSFTFVLWPLGHLDWWWEPKWRTDTDGPCEKCRARARAEGMCEWCMSRPCYCAETTPARTQP